MNELLKLLREAVGIRPLVPVLLVLLAAYLFKAWRGYPIRELFYDRWFLIAAIGIVSVCIAYFIYASGLAERTPGGRYGIYIASFAGDPDRSLHTRVVEALTANLEAKARDANMVVEVRDLKKEVTDQEIDVLRERTQELNATAMIWGRAIDSNVIYPRVWSDVKGLTRSSEPLNVTDISRLADFSMQVWEIIEESRDRQYAEPNGAANAKLREELTQLRADVDDLRLLVTSTAAVRSGTPGAIPGDLTAVLIGVGDYPDAGADLRGPKNDVAALRRVLLSRNREWKVTTLLDKEATQSKIENETLSAAHSLSPDVPLLVYLTGHGATTKNGRHYFMPYDYEWVGEEKVKAIELGSFFRQILKAHPKSILLVDAAFDPSELATDALSSAAVFTAGVRDEEVFESYNKGRYNGAFTAAFVEALGSVPPTISIPLKDLYPTVQSQLRREHPSAQPRLAVGPKAPSL